MHVTPEVPASQSARAQALSDLTRAPGHISHVSTPADHTEDYMCPRERHEMSENSEMSVNSVLVTARPNATPLGHPCTQRQGDAQRRAHTRRPRLHHTGGFVCGQGPIIKRFCRARAAGEARPVRVARPLPALHARAVLHTPRPGSRAARTRPRHAPAPALPHPPAPVHAARASRWPAPALPPQRARRKAPWLFAMCAIACV